LAQDAADWFADRTPVGRDFGSLAVDWFAGSLLASGERSGVAVAEQRVGFVAAVLQQQAVLLAPALSALAATLVQAKSTPWPHHHDRRSLRD
jgi:hypothetical protein